MKLLFCIYMNSISRGSKASHHLSDKAVFCVFLLHLGTLKSYRRKGMRFPFISHLCKVQSFISDLHCPFPYVSLQIYLLKQS